MNAIYSANYDNSPVRFVLSGGELFVSKADLFAITTPCFIGPLRQSGQAFLELGLTLIADGKDNSGAILGQSEIGPAIHFHAAGNLLHSLSDLNEVEHEDIRESSLRISAVRGWYAEAASAAFVSFGISIEGMMSSVAQRLERLNPALPVIVTYGDGMYTAECDALHLVTEAKTQEELSEAVWELVPDMIECNQLPLDPASIRLRFEFSQNRTQMQRMM